MQTTAKIPYKSDKTPRPEHPWAWKLVLVYDLIMMCLIIFNIFCLGMNAILMSDFGEWFANVVHLPQLLDYYRSELKPWVMITEGWFTTYLIIELLVRWAYATHMRLHQRWFFFPFIHWYEILAIIPALRFLRLLRAGRIAYNLHQHGYQVIPSNWYKRGQFYYHLILEELSSRIVLTVIDGVRRELQTSTTHKVIIHDLVSHHRTMFAQALAEVLQDSLVQILREQRLDITKNVGNIVNQAIEDTPELTQLLRLIPLVGGRIEQQIQSIGQRLGENITSGLIEPFTTGSAHSPNPHLQALAARISQLPIDQPALESLVESAVFEALEGLSKQVKVKQWQQMLEADQQQVKD